MAVIVGFPRATPVTENEPLVLPPVIDTLAGTVASVLSLLAREMVTPFPGAGPFSVIVTVAVWAMPTVTALGDKEMEACVTFAVILPARTFAPVAIIGVVPGATGVTDTVATDKPAATLIPGGIETTAGFAVKDTASPLAPAGKGNVIVNVPGAAVVRLKGFGVSEIAPAVTVTVEKLSVNPSFTFNCTTYVPAKSAWNIGNGVVAPVKVAVLLFGLLRMLQLYVSGSLSASEDPRPSRRTVAPTATV